MDALVALLSSEVVLHSDGGGKALAVPKPIYGPDRVARGILGSLRKLVPKNLVQRMVQVNGEPASSTISTGSPSRFLLST